jgi:hypothetical protein
MRLHLVVNKITCKVPIQPKRLGVLQARHRTVPVFSASASSNSNNNDSGTVQWINAFKRVSEVSQFFCGYMPVNPLQFSMLSISRW